MALNGSDFINNPWNTTWSPWTDLFERFVGNGQIFWLFPLIILTFGIYIKTESTIMVSMFMLGSGALLGFGTMAMGVPDMPIIFGLFAAIGLVPLFSRIIFGGN